ncbi:MAG: 2-polyprenyl-3-methyl-5-hydroxy-6-metoxy-1,4-benzoquinol methylase [Saprospiraceae bacterium]
MITKKLIMAEVNEEKLNALLGKMVGDLGAAVNGALVIVGDKLGLYRTLDKEGPLSSQQLADHTGTSERYIREWCSAQAAQGYLQYDPGSERFSLSPEQTMVFADNDSPVIMTGGFYAVSSVYHDEPRVVEAFKTGEGLSWGDHCNCLFCGTEKFFRPSYKHNLVQSWIPSLDGVEEKLQQGIKVADFGCGHAVSTIIMAEAYPNSNFVGIDIHPPSIEHAINAARELGLTNVTFEVGDATKLEGSGYEFITCFDCLHDMGDPAAVAASVKNIISPTGSWMLVEPFANDKLEDNLNPVGSTFYGFSTMICVPSSLSQPNAKALGAQAGEARLNKEVLEGGFASLTRTAETPFNLILEAKLTK